MVSNLIVAICAVIPLFFLMLVGFAVKKMRLLTELELAHVNRMVFKIFFFFMMFYNIYTTDLAETFRPHLMLFGAVGVLASALIGAVMAGLDLAAACRIASVFVCNAMLSTRHQPDYENRGVSFELCLGELTNLVD